MSNPRKIRSVLVNREYRQYVSAPNFVRLSKLITTYAVNPKITLPSTKKALSGVLHQAPNMAYRGMMFVKKDSLSLK